jgi:hypothetical protein
MNMTERAPREFQEFKNLRQNRNERFRRFFWDLYHKIYVWYEGDGSIAGFQLEYRHSADNSKAVLDWRRQSGFVHNAIDEGHACMAYPASHVLVPSMRRFDKKAVLARLRDSVGLQANLYQHLLHHIANYPKTGPS